MIPTLDDLVTVQNTVLTALEAHMTAQASREVPVPVMVGVTGACENIATLISVDAPSRLHLTQTGQLALDHYLAHFKDVYCVTPSFRSDVIDERHLSEFTLLEREFEVQRSIASGGDDGSAWLDELLRAISNLIKRILMDCLVYASGSVDHGGGDLEALAACSTLSDFPRITYVSAVRLVNAVSESSIQFGDDLSGVDEAAVLSHFKSEFGFDVPVFITHYPSAIKFFNMRRDDTSRGADTVLSADLLLPWAGESVGSAVRENRHDQLVWQLRESVMLKHLVETGQGSIGDFSCYLDLYRRETAVHAGFGLGLERLLQYLMAAGDIRAVSLRYRMSSQMGYADDLNRAQRGSLSAGF